MYWEREVRAGNTIEVKRYHTGRARPRGEPRQKRYGETTFSQEEVNRKNAEDMLRWLSVDVPEVGIYYVYALGASIPEGRTIKFTIGELKQIDPKYLPNDDTEGSEVSDVMWVTGTFHFTLNTVIDLSHNAVQIKNALDSGKIVKCNFEAYGLGMNLIFDVSYYSSVPSEAGYVLVAINSMVYLDLGEGNTLYFIQTFINTNENTNETRTDTQIVSVDFTA